MQGVLVVLVEHQQRQRPLVIVLYVDVGFVAVGSGVGA